MRQVGNAAILETSDEHVIYLERSGNVGECQNMFVLPGGHAEPSALGIDSQGRELAPPSQREGGDLGERQYLII